MTLELQFGFDFYEVLDISTIDLKDYFSSLSLFCFSFSSVVAQACAKGSVEMLVFVKR